MAKSSADCCMFTLFLGPHLIFWRGGLGLNHSRLVCVAPRVISWFIGP